MKRTLIALSCAAVLGTSTFFAPMPVQAQGWSAPFTNALQDIRNRFVRLTFSIPGVATSQGVVEQTLSELQTVDTVTTEHTIDARFTAGNGDESLLDISVRGPQVFSDTLTDVEQQDLTIEAQLETAAESFAATMQLRTIEDSTYIRIQEAPTVPFIDATQLRDQWIEFPTDPMAAGLAAGDAAETEPTAVPTTTTTASYRDAWLGMRDELEYGDLERTTLDDRAVYKTSITLTESALHTYIDAVAAIEEMDVEAVSSAKAQVSQFIESNGAPTVTLWIDRAEYRLRQVRYEDSFTSDSFEPLSQAEDAVTGLQAPGATPTTTTAEAEENGIDNMEIVIETRFSDYNQGVSIDVPTDAVPFQQLLQETLFGGSDATLPSGIGAGGYDLESLPGAGAGTDPSSEQLQQLEQFRQLQEQSQQQRPAEIPGLTPAQQRMMEQYQQ